MRKANTTDLDRPVASEAVFSCPNDAGRARTGAAFACRGTAGEGGCMSGEVLHNAAGEITVEALPAEEDARAALEAARAELEALRARWSASAPGNRRAWRRTRRRGVARRWSGALRPPREIGNFCTSTCARACLPTLPPRLRTRPTPERATRRCFPPSRGRKTASPPRTRRRPCPRPRRRNWSAPAAARPSAPCRSTSSSSLPSASRSAPAGYLAE